MQKAAKKEEFKHRNKFVKQKPVRFAMNGISSCGTSGDYK